MSLAIFIPTKRATFEGLTYPFAVVSPCAINKAIYQNIVHWINVKITNGLNAGRNLLVEHLSAVHLLIQAEELQSNDIKPEKLD